MTTTYPCPEGHQSADPEWCDTCGTPLAKQPTPAPTTARTAAVPAGAGSVGATVGCAHCGAVNEADALFCESCGYDFTTGQAPPPPPQPVGVAPPLTESAEPTDFSVDVTVDPAWYALQGAVSNEPCPPPVSQRLAVRGTSVQIGRTSAEKGLHPEVALNDDAGVSRRHAQLVQDNAGEWSAVDQGSMNGTYVVASGVALASVPDPIAVGEPVALAPGDRVFVGAWSCITLIDNRVPVGGANVSPES